MIKKDADIRAETATFSSGRAAKLRTFLARFQIMRSIDSRDAFTKAPILAAIWTKRSYTANGKA
jgi:hypothetical protein